MIEDAHVKALREELAKTPKSDKAPPGMEGKGFTSNIPLDLPQHADGECIGDECRDPFHQAI